MQGLFDRSFELPTSYFVAVALVVVLSVEALPRLRQLRGVFSVVVYATVALWYLFDPLVGREKNYNVFTPSELELAFAQICIFLISFRILIELSPKTPTVALRKIEEFDFDRGPIVKVTVIAWAILFTIGLARVNFNPITALFPLDARRNWESYMWNRPRIGTTTSFLISALGYLYTVICAFFGLLAVVTRRPGTRRLMIFLAMLTWPMFALTGARSTVLSVLGPTILGVLLTKRWSPWKMTAFAVSIGLVINLTMLAMIEFRNSGFHSALDGEAIVTRIGRAKHLGFNMGEELLYINRYQNTGQLKVEMGMNYLGNLLNFIPRPIWPGKPFVGREFALLRTGLYRGDVAATISFGIVGQGVANFGPWLGPAIPALFLVLYCSWAIRLLNTGHIFLRCCLFFIALAKVPNLGRDITLFDLWIVVFGYIATLMYERLVESRAARRKKLIHSPRGSTARPSHPVHYR
ncbi:MAG TPA: hypothetical protein VM452_06465 [Caulifigura sp.]|nr:hypothetical protein [Caulifigura sp.]